MFEIVSYKFLREIRITCFRDKEEQMVEFPEKELISAILDRISVSILLNYKGQAHALRLETKAYDL